MLEKDIVELVRTDAPHTASQIRRQPKIWDGAIATYKEAQTDVDALIGRARAAAGVMAGDDPVDGSEGTLLVVLTGTGSALNAALAVSGRMAEAPIPGCDVTCVAAADLAEAPADHTRDARTVLLVAFSQGEDKQLEKAVAQVRSQVKNLFVLGITCDREDPLASAVAPDDDGLVIAVPEVASAADEKATPEVDGEPADLAAFTGLTVMGLLCLDGSDLDERLNWLSIAHAMAEMVLMDETALAALVTEPFDNIAVLSANLPLSAVGREAAIQAPNFACLAKEEGTAPEVVYGDLSSAAIDTDITHDALALALIAGSDDDRETQIADLKAMSAFSASNGCTRVAVQADNGPLYQGRAFTFDGFAAIPPAYLSLPYLMAVQVVLLMASVK